MEDEGGAKAEEESPKADAEIQVEAEQQGLDSALTTSSLGSLQISYKNFIMGRAVIETAWSCACLVLEANRLMQYCAATGRMLQQNFPILQQAMTIAQEKHLEAASVSRCGDVAFGC